MLKLVILSVIVIFVQIGAIESQLNPSCAVYDFNDPFILDQFEDCTKVALYLTHPLIIKSYNDSLFEPYRPTSERFLTTNSSLNKMQSLCTKSKFRVSFDGSGATAFKMGYNLRNNETNSFNNWQFFVGNVWAQQLESKSDGWESYERNYNFNFTGLPSNYYSDFHTIGIRAEIGSHSNLAIEYIKFYNPLLTDENCNDLKPNETATEVPITESTTEASIIDTTTNVPITETTTHVTATTDPTTTEYSKVTTTEAPLVGNRPCLKIDFNQSNLDHFQECYSQYLPSFIQKSYTSSSIQPFRNASTLFLSNKWEGLSCLESISIFSLNESSVVQSAIYLNGLWPGAWIQVYIIDENSGDRQDLINMEPNANWSVQSKNINRKFDNARIFIMANMNSYSQLALEYLNVLNSNSTYSPCRV